MTPLDAFWHLVNLFAVPALAGLLAAVVAKLVWRRALAGVAWTGLARDAALAASLVALAGLVVTGRDGRMATYGAMVLACALTLWWRGFRRG
jgi:hypothetical protein